MSIKRIHLAFIAFCSLFALGFSAWCLLIPGMPGTITAMGWISLVGGVTLVVYGVRFYRKAKSVIV